MRLTSSRLASRKIIKKGGGASKPESEKPTVNIVEGTLMLIFALMADVLDWLIIGSIPILGDIFDVIVWGIIYLWVKIRGFDQLSSRLNLGALFVELVPFGDVIPSFTIAVLGIILLNSALGRMMMRRFMGKPTRAILNAVSNV